MTNAETLRPYLKKALFLHFILLLALFFFYPTSEKREKRGTVRVSTVQLAPPSVKQASPKKASPSPSPKVETPPKPTPPLKKETSKKKEVPKAEVKKEIPKIDSQKEKLLKEARESLAKMDKGEATSPEKGRSSLKPLSSLKSEEGSFLVKGENDLYTGELIKRLKLSLRLPESGEVVVDLKLQRSGRVALVKIREAKSSINKKYVESTLPNLNFPEFGEFYPKEDEKLFTLSLQNELF